MVSLSSSSSSGGKMFSSTRISGLAIFDLSKAIGVFSLLLSGKETTNVVPWPTAECSSILPCMASTTCFTSESPIPVPMFATSLVP